MGVNTHNELEICQTFQKLSAQGDRFAMNGLALMHIQGIGGLRQNPGEGIRLILKAAALGEPRAISNLGLIYQQGIGGTPRDEEKAITMYREAIQKASTSALVRLGRMYEFGSVKLERNESEAAKLYLMAVDGSDQSAEAYIGWMNANSLSHLAADWYKDIAKSEVIAASESLAFMYLFGVGGLPENLEEARRLCYVAVEGGSVSCKLYIPLIYLLSGPVNREEALRFASEAVKVKMPGAQKIHMIVSTGPVGKFILENQRELVQNLISAFFTEYRLRRGK